MLRETSEVVRASRCASRTCDHLEEPGAGGREFIEANDSSQGGIQRAEHKSNEQEYRHSPPREARVARVIGYKKHKRSGKTRRRLKETLTCLSYAIRHYQYDKIPPARNLLVGLHFLVMLKG